MSAFPDVRWGTDNPIVRRPIVWFSGTYAGSWLIRRAAPLDRWLLRRSHGRFTVLGPFAVPLLLLTTTGSKSGQPRTTPLVYARQDDAVVVVGSNFGSERHPAWSTNLLAHPEATVEIGGVAVPVTAELLAGAEAESAYRLMADVARTYDVYRERTDREIRVFRLTPRAPRP